MRLESDEVYRVAGCAMKPRLRATPRNVSLWAIEPRGHTTGCWCAHAMVAPVSENNESDGKMAKTARS